MKLGVDFGTTRIVAAVADRGNYPVVSFETPDSDTADFVPSLAAFRGEERLYGWRAWAAQSQPGWTVVRSLKRILCEAGPQSRIEVDGQPVSLTRVLEEMAAAFREALVKNSTLPAAGPDALEVMLGVPANANSNQRFMTVEAFRNAGFNVLGLMNEPSAAAVEYMHRNAGQKSRTRLLVYDLGGGTFDASLVEAEDGGFGVVASEGIGTLGGDDFDEILAGLALDSAGISQDERDTLTQAEHFLLHEECRQKKETLHPNTRKLVVDLESVRSGWPAVPVTVSEFYERAKPLVAETLHAVEDLLESQGMSDRSADALYVTGGASELPIVPRELRERFGRTVLRSQYSRSASAIGLAIHAGAEPEKRTLLRERFTRHFGVWREADSGRNVLFDPLFTKGSLLPPAGEPPLTVTRQYFAVHNVGHFRYLECSRRDDDGRPSGDITVWDEIRFPFDPELRNIQDLTAIPVTHSTDQPIEETFTCDSGGAVQSTISNLGAGYSRSYRLGRWQTSALEAPVKPGKKPRASRKKSTSGGA